MTEEQRTPSSIRKRKALDDIIAEREYQLKRWGVDHDLKHTKESWLTILTVWLGKTAVNIYPYASSSDQDTKDGFRKRLIQIAAICLAALETMDE